MQRSTATLEPKVEAKSGAAKTMKALVYRMARNETVRPSGEDEPHTVLQHPEEAMVRRTTAMLCGGAV